MAHEAQERYSTLVLAKIRKENKLKNGVVFNTDYEGSPKAGVVKIPVRDTEVEVSDYGKLTITTEGSGDIRKNPSVTFEEISESEVQEILNGS